LRKGGEPLKVTIVASREAEQHLVGVGGGRV